MRIEAVSKMGYYPCPNETLQMTCSCIQPENNQETIRILDPCVGAGEALHAVGTDLRNQGGIVTTFGVELSDQRVEIAKAVINCTLHADWFDVAMSHKSVSLLFLNPPYTNEEVAEGEKRQRMEYMFLRDSIRTLQPHGLLVFIVPLHIFQKPQISKFVAGHFSQVRLFKLPDEEFRQFGQCVVFGTRNEKIVPNERVQMQLEEYASGFCDIPVLDYSICMYQIPASQVSDDKLIFRKVTLHPDEVIEIVSSKHNAHSKKEWQDIIAPQGADTFQPVVPLRIGHVASMISSGMMGTVRLGSLLAKGRTVKTTEYVDADGNPIPPNQVAAFNSEESLVKKEREKFLSTVMTLDENGNHTIISTPSELEEFMKEHAVDIAKILQEQYQPLYEKPTDDEWRIVFQLMKSKRLPGRKEAGMLLAQKHTSIAASRVLKRLGHVTLACMMGTGKSVLSLATVELLNAYPAIVICPTHIVSKWCKEVSDAIPGAMGVIVESITDLQELERTYQPGQKVVAVLSKERIKLGSGWKPATIQKHRRVAVGMDEDNNLSTELRKVHCCPTCGEPVRDRDGFYIQIMPNKRLFCKAKDEDDTVCGAPLFEYNGFRRWPLATYIKNQMRYFFKAGIFDESHKFKAKSTDAGSAYHKLVDSVKYSINATGTLMGGKSTDLFWLRYRICSQVRREYDFNHEIRWAEHFGRLEFTLDVGEDDEDGKFSGQRRHRERAKELPGISPAIYRHLLPSTIFLKIEDLGYQLPEYRETIVPIQMSLEQQLQYEWLDSTLYGHIIGCFEAYDSEAKKEAQKLLSVWLQNCLSRPNSAFRPEFVQWKRPGIEKTEYEHVAYGVLDVPNFEAQAIEIEGTDEQRSHNRFDWLEIETSEDDSHEETYADVMAEFDRLLTIEKGKLEELDSSLSPMALYPVVRPGDLLPKEQWLLDYCVNERAENRKVLIYVRQSGTRDIQPRLAQLLQDAGIRAMILPRNVSARKREKWILDRVDDLDVLICNPMMTETGLDLVQFSTCIFYEISYSMFVLAQSCRRVWRLGQTKPVKVLFPIYTGTAEEAALTLMGMKTKALNTLYGDTAASAIAENAGDGNFLSELANRLLAGENLKADGITGLLGDVTPEVQDSWDDYEVVQQSETDSEAYEDLLYESIIIVNPWEKWLSEVAPSMKFDEVFRKRKTRKKQPEPSKEQLALFTMDAGSFQPVVN
ncbi:MAG: DUF6094 domain-containing protein [Chloroflexota bacterium]